MKALRTAHGKLVGIICQCVQPYDGGSKIEKSVDSENAAEKNVSVALSTGKALFYYIGIYIINKLM